MREGEEREGNEIQIISVYNFSKKDGEYFFRGRGTLQRDLPPLSRTFIRSSSEVKCR